MHRLERRISPGCLGAGSAASRPSPAACPGALRRRTGRRGGAACPLPPVPAAGMGTQGLGITFLTLPLVVRAAAGGEMLCLPALIPRTRGGRRGWGVPAVGEDGGSWGVGLGCACASPLYSLPFPMCRGGDAGPGAGGSHASRAGGRDWGTWSGPPALPPPPHWRMSALCHGAPGGLSPPGAVCPGRRRLGRGPFRVGGCSGTQVLGPSPPTPQTCTTRGHQQGCNLRANRCCHPGAEALECSPAFGSGWRQRVLPWLLPEGARGRARMRIHPRVSQELGFPLDREECPRFLP